MSIDTARAATDRSLIGAVRPVILSGGGGTRLWPVSRLSLPKQLLAIQAEDTMLQATAARCHSDLFRPLVVITGEEHRFSVAEQLADTGSPQNIILEPVARNTAAAIALAAHWALAEGEDEPILVMPSDHVIDDVGAFVAAIGAGVGAARDNVLVTFGIEPDSPNVGYGYIEAAPGEVGASVHKVLRFVEKPDAARAAQFLAQGNHYWNAGIFLFRPSVFLEELARHAPAVATAVAESMAAATRDGLFVRPEAGAFARAQNISVDYAVMENTDRAFVLPLRSGWSDVGAWDSLWALLPKDGDGNALRGDVLALDSDNCLLRSEGGATLAVVGLEDMIVVATRDAILVTPRSRAQDVKAVVEQLRRQGQKRADETARAFRPWGSYETMDRGERFQTKRIIVNPGGKLSLQKHFHRSEHWIVVSGTAEVTVGDQVRLLQENQSTYIPAGEVHRLSNPGKLPLHLIEVQCGPYLGEDDIVRLEDTYGRD